VAAAGVASAITKRMVAVARPISGKALPQTQSLSAVEKLLWQQQRLIPPPSLISRACEQAIKPEGISDSDNIARSVVIESESDMEVDLLGWAQAIHPARI
jgi:hypothetical protein